MSSVDEEPARIPILDAYARDKALAIDPTEEGLVWMVKIDGQPVQDDHEGGPLRLPVDVEPDDLVDAVCPADGREHQVEAVLRGGRKAAIRASVRLGAHRRMPPTEPTPTHQAVAPERSPFAGYPSQLLLRPPDAAWTGLLELTSTAQAAQFQAMAAERSAHMALMSQMHQQQMVMVSQALESLKHVAAAASRPAPAATAPASAEAAPAPDFLSQALTHGMGLMNLVEKGLNLAGLTGEDVKSLVMKAIAGGVAAEEGVVKRALAEQLGNAMTLVADAGADWIRGKAGVAKNVGEAAEGLAQAAGELVGE